MVPAGQQVTETCGTTPATPAKGLPKVLMSATPPQCPEHAVQNMDVAKLPLTFGDTATHQLWPEQM